jgi:Zn-dependent peptidase ImmA (M78 family)
MLYENLQMEAACLGVEVYERPMQPALKGLYADNIIWINRCIPTVTERACILAEELGHYHTSVGNIIDPADIRNRRQELRARDWAYRRLVPLSKIVQAYHAGVADRHELAEYLGVSEQFLQSAVDRYREKYGTYTIVDGHIIYFDPLAVAEMFD